MRISIDQIMDEINDRLEHVGVWITSRTNPRSRWVGSTVIVLGLHLVFFWVLIVSKTESMRLKAYEEVIYPVELYDLPKPEEIPEVEPVTRPVPEEAVQQQEEAVQPSEVQKEAQPQAQVEPQPVPQPQPHTVEAPRRSTTVKPVDLSDLSRRQQPEARDDSRREVSADPTQAPSLRKPGVKKRTEEEELAARAQEATRRDATRNVSDLNLHVPDRITADAPTSGLTAAARKPAGTVGGGGGAGGTPAGGLSPGALTGLSGGRSGVSQAIQNHNSCVELQQAGKPIPESCNMPALASQGRMGPKPDRDFQTAANQRDANLRYKTTPGSTDYWKRVNASPSPGGGGRDDGLPKKGAYSSEKDARVMNGDNIDPKNGN